MVGKKNGVKRVYKRPIVRGEMWKKIAIVEQWVFQQLSEIVGGYHPRSLLNQVTTTARITTSYNPAPP